MKQSRVLSLTYRITSDAHTCYEEPEVMRFTNYLGRFELKQGRMTFWPDEDFRTATEVRGALAPFLHDWEMHVAISDVPGALKFVFEQAEVQESPATTESFARLEGVATVSFTAVASMTLTRKAYPAPPQAFQVTTEVELAYRRWQAYREGREPLLSMAYLIYTIFAPPKGRSRREAAKFYSVDEQVLHTLSGVASVRGGLDDARKFNASGNAKPLADHERAWLEATIRRLVYRLGELAAGAALAQIRMEDLPQPSPRVGDAN